MERRGGLGYDQNRKTTEGKTMGKFFKNGLSYEHTIKACFIGYIVQAIVNNFAPLLFLTFQQSYGIPLSRITLLITFNFCVQLSVDLLSAGFIDRIGYRAAMMLAHILSAAGLVALAVLPELLPSPFAGLIVAVMIYAVGGGLLEVLVSPVVEACPTDNKEAAMSLLHSFYCWGQMGVVLLSSVFFAVFGIAHWRVLALLWAVIPALNCLLFAKVPIYTLIEEGGRGTPLAGLVKSRTFWLLLVLMVCSGASEGELEVRARRLMGEEESFTLPDATFRASWAMYLSRYPNPNPCRRRTSFKSAGSGKV